MRVLVAFLAAVLVPTLSMAAWYLYGQFSSFPADDPYIWIRTRNFLVICLSVAGAYVVALGIPTYLLLRKLNAIRWWSTIGAGFFLSAVPVAIFAWPLRYSDMNTSATVDGVQTMINGVPTTAGWLQYVSGFSFFGACGAVAALSFLGRVAQVIPNNALQATRKTLAPELERFERV
jgi:hypothetical protein